MRINDKLQRLVSAMALTNLVCVKGCTARAGQRPNGRAFSATGDSADECAAGRAHGSRQLISVLLPESALVVVAVVNVLPRGRLTVISRVAVASVPRSGQAW